MSSSNSQPEYMISGNNIEHESLSIINEDEFFLQDQGSQN